MRILVVTRSYPSAGDLYQYPFVHRRVLAYRAAGHDVAVFRPASGETTTHVFEGVTCFGGGAEALQSFARDWRPEVIAAHGFSEEMWTALAPIGAHIPIRAWLHGSEILGIFRRKALSITDEAERASALASLVRRAAFWRHLLATKPDRFKLVFVSHSAADLAREDWGKLIHNDDFAVIPNPIDTDLFEYRAKSAEDRFRVLMIRPFDAWTYGNDLAVGAILQFADRPGFERMQFTIFGDREQFEQTVAPLRRFQNVKLEQRFLTQGEIAEQHRSHGIFLVPTRLDTHGVSRDEAMASGLVPVTNNVSAVSEFVDESCAALAGPEDVQGLADEMWGMVQEPQLFLSRSAKAAERVRGHTSHQLVIPAELHLLTVAADG